MKKLFFLIVLLTWNIAMMAQPPGGPASSGMTFGEKITADSAVQVNDLAAALAGTTGAPVKVQGQVAEVCTMEGCWLKMKTAGGTMMIKMKDHSFLVPLSMNGKTIVAQGTASIKEVSVAMQQHYAEDAGKTKEEIAAIKTPKKEMIMEATGIIVL